MYEYQYYNKGKTKKNKYVKAKKIIEKCKKKMVHVVMINYHFYCISGTEKKNNKFKAKMRLNCLYTDAQWGRWTINR